jgi:hypothetical protein
MPEAAVAFDGIDAALQTANAQRIIAGLAAAGTDLEGLCREMHRISEAPETKAGLDRIRGLVVAATGETAEEFNRVALLAAAASSHPRLEEIAVPAEVKARLRAVFERFAAAPGSAGFRTTGGPANRFVQFAKLATLRRWPAGLWDWEESGLPRSWVPRIRPLGALLKTVDLVGRRWRGFRPAFFGHLTICRQVHALTPRETMRSYVLIAEALELQPHVNGMILAAWFHSPDTFTVSPHLAWLNDVFLRNGGIVATIGAAAPDCGVFARSPERQQAYDEGRFAPTIGLIVWPREEMIAWAKGSRDR